MQLCVRVCLEILMVIEQCSFLINMTLLLFVCGLLKEFAAVC